MQVQCTDKKTALEVQTIFLKYNIKSRQQGPKIGDTAIWVMPIGAVLSEKESDIRREIQRIAGATIV